MKKISACSLILLSIISGASYAESSKATGGVAAADGAAKVAPSSDPAMGDPMNSVVTGPIDTSTADAPHPPMAPAVTPASAKAKPADSNPPKSIIPYITVATSPYFSQQTAFDASDIWSQQSTMNEDLFILKYRQGLEHGLNQNGTSLANRPIIELSGAVEAFASENVNNFGNGTSGDINLNTAELDINAMVSTWANAYMSFEFDNSPPDIGSRVNNSRIYLSRGFVTIGNMDVTPVYLTVGQFYLPFGRYASYMITAPVTLTLGRINDRALLLGYYNQGLYASIYTFPGNNSRTNDSPFRQAGANLGYKFLLSPNGDNNITLGGGVVTDMTDSNGITSTGNVSPEFPGFSTTPAGSAYPLQHNVPGADIHSEFNWGPWSVVGEFISALREYSTEDMTFNNDGAAPKAGHLELWRTFKLGSQDWLAGAAYGHTWDSLAIALPQQSYDAYLRTSFWKNTVEEIEFRHDVDYSKKDFAISATEFGPYFNQGSGSTREIVLAQIGVYF
jgi:hypothetical protein